MKLPWKPCTPNWDSHKNLAVGRLEQLRSRVKRETDLCIRYSVVLQEHRDLGFVERVPSSPPPSDEIVHYIPHHAVLKEESVTTELRVVSIVQPLVLKVILLLLNLSRNGVTTGCLLELPHRLFY